MDHKSQQHQVNQFDELGADVNTSDAQQQAKELKAKHEKIDYLIHKLFQQNEEGRELLGVWMQSLLFKPCAEPGMDNIEIGINEGYKRFIRNIKLTIDRVEQS